MHVFKRLTNCQLYLRWCCS